MTTFFEDGEIDFFGSLHPIDFYVETSILSTTTYSITVTIGIEVLLQRLHFSQIIFDQVDVEASRVYTIVAQQLDAPDSNHFIEVPAEFVDNFITSTASTMSPSTTRPGTWSTSPPSSPLLRPTPTSSTILCRLLAGPAASSRCPLATTKSCCS